VVYLFFVYVAEHSEDKAYVISALAKIRSGHKLIAKGMKEISKAVTGTRGTFKRLNKEATLGDRILYEFNSFST